MKTKECTKCREVKSYDEFYVSKVIKDGLYNWCKNCYKEYTKQYHENHKEVEKERHRIYHKNNKEAINERQKQWREDNEDYFKEYYKNNKEAHAKRTKKYREENKIAIAQWRKDNKDYIKKYNKQWEENNKEIRNQYHRQYNEDNKEARKQWRENNKEIFNKRMKERRHSDIQYRILTNLRSRLQFALNGRTKSATTKELLGCSIEALWLHLEANFQQGMTKENYGKWHVDHIQPCSLFDLSDPEQQRECFNHKNLQPLWAEDNFTKSNKLIKPS